MAIAILLVIALPGSVLAGKLRPRNYVTKTVTVHVSPGHRTAATATCPAGDRIVTGGVEFHLPHATPDSTLPVAIDSSAPTRTLKGWYGAGRNNGASMVEMKVTAECLPSRSFPAYAVETRTITVHQNRSGNTFLACPNGDEVVSGGGTWQKKGKQPSGALNAYLTSTSPGYEDGADGETVGADYFVNGWVVAGHNNQRVLQLHAVLLCIQHAAVPGYRASSAGNSVSYGSAEDSSVACDTGTRLLGGGVEWDSDSSPEVADTTATLLASTVTEDGLAFYGAGRQNDGDASLALDFTTICVDD